MGRPWLATVDGLRRDVGMEILAHQRTSRSACSAPAALIDCRMLIRSRGPTPSAFRLATRSRSVTPEVRMPSFLSCWSSIWMLVRGTTVVVPLRERRRLADLRRLGHPDGQVALGDRDGADPHVGAHDDGAARLVDHHDGGVVRLDAQVLDRRQRLDRVAAVEIEQHGARVGRPGDRAERRLMTAGDALARWSGPGCADRAQRPLPLSRLKGISFSTVAPLAMRAGGRHAAGDRDGRAARGDRAGGERALRDRVDLAVGGQQRGDQQRAAGQVGGIAEGGDRDVDPAAAAGEGGQFGGDHDGGEVLGRQLRRPGRGC